MQLRPLTEDDAAMMLRLLNQPDWLEFVGDRNVHSLEDAGAYLRNGALKAYADLGYGPYAVVVGDDVAGICGLMQRPWLPAADLGYALLSEFQGRGYAVEAARAAAAYARDTLGMPRLLAIVEPTHTRSTRLLTALGFKHMGPVRVPGEAEDIALYQLDLVELGTPPSAAEVAVPVASAVESVVGPTVPTAPPS